MWSTTYVEIEYHLCGDFGCARSSVLCRLILVDIFEFFLHLLISVWLRSFVEALLKLLSFFLLWSCLCLFVYLFVFWESCVWWCAFMISMLGRWRESPWVPVAMSAGPVYLASFKWMKKPFSKWGWWPLSKSSASHLMHPPPHATEEANKLPHSDQLGFWFIFVTGLQQHCALGGEVTHPSVILTWLTFLWILLGKSTHP